MPRRRIESERGRKVSTLATKISFDSTAPKKHFDESIRDIRDKFAIARREKNNDIHSAEEIWRSQIVFLDSALDFYIHEVSKLGVTKIFNRKWKETEKYRNLRVTLDFALRLSENAISPDRLLGEIDEINQRNCFMKFENLQRTLEIVGLDADSSFKPQINALYSRRNQIAHQSDRLHDNPVKQPITEAYVEQYINIVENFVEDIENRINDKTI